jgi:glyoxylase-like metal-dependent hydrolase (beta-lactamase superfamily II)
MQVGIYEIDIIIQGFPGKSVYHGGLGWSTVVLIRGSDRVALIDTGPFGMRRVVIERLAKYGLKPTDVTDVLLTHAHHDHMVNWTLFPQARIAIGARELEQALKAPWGDTLIPELYISELHRWPTLRTISDGEQLLPGITAHVAPGHTPGHLIFLLSDREHDVIFSGDAAKNRAELISRNADMTYDPAVSSASISKIWDLWRRRPGTLLVPGHDVPMILEDGTDCRYVGKREAALKAWFGDSLDSTTLFELLPT